LIALLCGYRLEAIDQADVFWQEMSYKDDIVYRHEGRDVLLSDDGHCWS
jgi:hypothetical protein